MREQTIERKLVVATKNMGGLALKFISPSFDGMPDRIVLLPGGHIGFVEVKAMGCKPRPLQFARHGLLRRLGFKVSRSTTIWWSSTSCRASSHIRQNASRR